MTSPGHFAAVQRALDADGRHLFLLKAGTLLQHRLDATARTTEDVDGLIRGDLDESFLALEEALTEPWGPLTPRRGETEVVNASKKIIKPRRFDVILTLRGVTWRRIQLEVSPDETGVGGGHEMIEPPPQPTARPFPRSAPREWRSSTHAPTKPSTRSADAVVAADSGQSWSLGQRLRRAAASAGVALALDEAVSEGRCLDRRNRPIVEKTNNVGRPSRAWFVAGFVSLGT